MVHAHQIISSCLPQLLFLADVLRCVCRKSAVPTDDAFLASTERWGTYFQPLDGCDPLPLLAATTTTPKGAPSPKPWQGERLGSMADIPSDWADQLGLTTLKTMDAQQVWQSVYMPALTGVILSHIMRPSPASSWQNVAGEGMSALAPGSYYSLHIRRTDKTRGWLEGKAWALDVYMAVLEV